MPRCAGTPGTGDSTSATSAGPTVSPGIAGRSRPGKDGWSRIDCSSVGHPSTCVACSRSMRSRAAPGSNRSMHRTVAPDCSAAPSISVPPIQKNGNAQKKRGGPAPLGNAAERARRPHDGAVRVHDSLRLGTGSRRVGDLRQVAGNHFAPRPRAPGRRRSRPRRRGARRSRPGSPTHGRSGRSSRSRAGRARQGGTTSRSVAAARSGTVASSMSCMSRPSTERAVSSVSTSPMRRTVRISAGR